MDVVLEGFDPNETAAALFAEKDGRWTVELTFSHRPDAAALRDIVARVAGKAAARTLTFTTVKPRDWIAASLAGLRPVTAGRFVIHGRHDRAHIAPSRIAVEIEAALAFGTGHHATTRGCLLALDALAKRRPALRARVLDLGTGSGVLAIAAAKALRRAVVASDIDRTAVMTARANARLNGVAPLIETVYAAGVAAPRLRARTPYDVVFANILLAPLKRLARPIARGLAKDARVILSGLLTREANAALASYRAQGLALERRIGLDGWTTLVLARSRRNPQAMSPPRRAKSTI